MPHNIPVLKDKNLSLPKDWEMMLEQILLENSTGQKHNRIYICSPCRSDTARGVLRNMKAARIYMFYAYFHFAGVPKAPHAYLPVLLGDNDVAERTLALDFGKRLLEGCDRLFVCGDKLSEGMYGEIAVAISLNIAVEVFCKEVWFELLSQLEHDGINADCVRHEETHLHLALSWGADKLAPYWEVA